MVVGSMVEPTFNTPRLCIPFLAPEKEKQAQRSLRSVVVFSLLTNLGFSRHGC